MDQPIAALDRSSTDSLDSSTSAWAWGFLPAAGHHEIRKYYQSTCKAKAEVLQNLMVLGGGLCPDKLQAAGKTYLMASSRSDRSAGAAEISRGTW